MKANSNNFLLRCFFFVVAAVLLHGCTATGSSGTDALAKALGDEDSRLHAWFEMKHEEELQASPIWMTYLGRKDKNDEVDDFSFKADEERLEWAAQSVAEMEEQFDYDKLSPQNQVSYDLWKYQYEVAAANHKYVHHDYIFEQMGGAQSWLPTS